MNYSQSEIILQRILNSRKKILINCHRSPDADSAGSALALHLMLKKLGHETQIVCVDNLDDSLRFLPASENVQRVDFGKFSYNPYDLFIVPDSGEWKMVAGIDIKPPIDTIVIDHHKTNVGFGKMNLIDADASSCAEVIFQMFVDWNTEVDPDIAHCLMAGIIGDTGAFEYPNTSANTLKIASRLLELGADKKQIILNLFRSKPFEELQMWGEFLKVMQFDKQNEFVWTALPYEIYEKIGKVDAKSSFASIFTQIVKGSNFGIAMLEDTKNHLSISLRARENFDVSVIAKELGGGGHKGAAGGEVVGMKFDEAVKKVLEIAVKHAKEPKKRN